MFIVEMVLHFMRHKVPKTGNKVLTKYVFIKMVRRDFWGGGHICHILLYPFNMLKCHLLILMKQQQTTEKGLFFI